MQHYNTNQYVEIFNKLPPEIKDVVAASNTTEHLFKIGQAHQLHIDKIGIMNDISLDVMMGIIASKNFVGELQKELQISAFDASALARDIDEEIFKPIKNTMINLYADGAPNKPSSSLVQFYEEDEEHKNLDKHLLLKEIENPAAAIKRVEMVPASRALETAEEVKDLQKMESQAGINPQTKIEIKKVEVPVAPKVPEPVPVVAKEIPAPEAKEPPKMESMMEKIASLKLTQTFVMPKHEGDIASLSAKISNPIVSAASPKPKEGAPGVEKAVPASTPYTPPASKSYPVDPYREPIA